MMTWDVIVVGSGLIGAICARHLAEQGLTVLMLEEGDVISTPPGNHLRNQIQYQENPDSFFDEIMAWCSPFNANAPAEQLPGANVTHAFGGQGLIWTNNCPRPTAHELYPAYSVEEWDRYFCIAEQYLSVHQDLFNDSIRQKKIIEHLLPSISPSRKIEPAPLAAQRLPNGTIEYSATYSILTDSESIRAKITIECGVKVISIETSNGHAGVIPPYNRTKQN